jgi:hypothetical protein
MDESREIAVIPIWAWLLLWFVIAPLVPVAFVILHSLEDRPVLVEVPDAAPLGGGDLVSCGSLDRPGSSLDDWFSEEIVASLSVRQEIWAEEYIGQRCHEGFERRRDQRGLAGLLGFGGLALLARGSVVAVMRAGAPVRELRRWLADHHQRVVAAFPPEPSSPELVVLADVAARRCADPGEVVRAGLAELVVTSTLRLQAGDLGRRRIREVTTVEFGDDSTVATADSSPALAPLLAAVRTARTTRGHDGRRVRVLHSVTSQLRLLAGYDSPSYVGTVRRHLIRRGYLSSPLDPGLEPAPTPRGEAARLDAMRRVERVAIAPASGPEGSPRDLVKAWVDRGFAGPALTADRGLLEGTIALHRHLVAVLPAQEERRRMILDEVQRRGERPWVDVVSLGGMDPRLFGLLASVGLEPISSASGGGAEASAGGG